MRQTIIAAAVAVAAIMPLAADAAPVTIGFENLGVPSGSVAPYNGSSEAGFDLTTSGDQLLANNVPTVVGPLSGTFINSPNSGVTSGTITITELNTADPFRFVGLDGLGNGTGSLPTIDVSGFLGGNLIATDVFQTTNVETSFMAVNLLDRNIDSLLITLNTTAAGPTTFRPSFVDNIALNTTPIPLPAAAWLLIGGLGALGVVGRKRRAA